MLENAVDSFQGQESGDASDTNGDKYSESSSGSGSAASSTEESSAGEEGYGDDLLGGGGGTRVGGADGGDDDDSLEAYDLWDDQDDLAKVAEPVYLDQLIESECRCQTALLSRAA